MKKRCLIVTAISMALTIGSAMSTFAAGFESTPQGVKYRWGSGDYCINNWVNFKGHWYFFGNDELMRTGWIQRDDSWYFTTDTGELQGGIMKINGNVYYFNTNSLKMVTRPYTYNETTYNFTENGTTGGAPYVYTEWNSDGTIRRGNKIKVR